METTIAFHNGLEIVTVSDGWMVEDDDCMFFVHDNGGDVLISLEIS